jgi:hypothetical protein
LLFDWKKESGPKDPALGCPKGNGSRLKVRGTRIKTTKENSISPLLCAL